MVVRITTLAERPELAGALQAMESPWPKFIRRDPMSCLYYPIAETVYPEFILLADDDAAPGEVIARAFSVPFVKPEGELPDNGWDAAVEAAWHTRRLSAIPDVVSALGVTVRADRQGEGLSSVLVAALRANCARLGYTEMLVPVRPTAKHREPRTPMAEYAFRTRPDGLPFDPWLRVHVRAGAEIVKVAPRSMTISGTLAEWRAWTGLTLDRPGPIEIPQALVPVHCDPDQNHAVYVEPNIWVSHSL